MKIRTLRLKRYQASLRYHTQYGEIDETIGAWNSMRPVGREFGSPDYERLGELDCLVRRASKLVDPASLQIKVYLDDERPIPIGWIGVRWPDEAIDLLESCCVTEISLDHDLGDDESRTGYDVILWIEEAVALRGFVPPQITVHSANSSARMKMEAGISKIMKIR